MARRPSRFELPSLINFRRRRGKAGSIVPMLFIESKTLSHSVSGAERIRLLEQLQEKGRTPLVRSARLNSFANILLDAEQIRDLEAAMAARVESDYGEQYVRGDLFCPGD